MEILQTLGINWQLLIAQLFNFLVLAGVLTYFVYKPVLKVLDERRERIRKSMEDAKHIESQRKEIEQFKIDQLKKMDQETTAFLDKARSQAEKAKEEMLQEAQKEAAEILKKAKQQLEDERVKLVAQVQNSVAKLTVMLAEKVLQREFTDADQQRMLQSLEKQIPTLMQK